MDAPVTTTPTPAAVPAPAPAAVPPPAAAPPAAPPAAPAPAPAAVLPVVPATAAPAPAPAAPAPAAPAEKPDPATEMASRLRALELRTVIAETGLDASMAEFITANDEAGMKAQAVKLKGAMGTAAPAATPAAGGETPTPAPAPAPAAGTVTNPPAPAQPTIDERIAAAEKAGKVGLSIQLKREKAGMRA